ncbi:MAG: hypothetical protein ACR2OW_09205 [Methyloligellaceae bacterium]
MDQDNQTPEQQARDNIDKMLKEAGWIAQHKKKLDFNAGLGIAVREWGTEVGPSDCVLFVDRKPVGVVEAKPESWGQNITVVEEQSGGYAGAPLKIIENEDPLPLIYESTGVVTRFTDTLGNARSTALPGPTCGTISYCIFCVSQKAYSCERVSVTKIATADREQLVEGNFSTPFSLQS